MWWRVEGAQPGQEITKPRETEVALAQRQSMARGLRGTGVTEQTYYRWRKEYGGRWPTWRWLTRSLGEAAEGGLPGPTARRGPSRRPRQVLAAPGCGWGLPGVGPALARANAAAPVRWTREPRLGVTSSTASRWVRTGQGDKRKQ